MTRRSRVLALVPMVALGACRPQEAAAPAPAAADASAAPAAPAPPILRVSAGQEVLELARIWAAEHAKLDPSFTVEVSAAFGEPLRPLLEGTAELALGTRPPAAEEAAALRPRGQGRDPVAATVAYDLVCVYVHAANPMSRIDVSALVGIYRESPKRIDRWAQVGVPSIAGVHDNTIVRVAPGAHAPARAAFRALALGGRAPRSSALDAQDTRALLDLVAATPSAIGYGELCTPAPGVKVLKVGAPGVPALAPLLAGGGLAPRYPLARPLVLVTAGHPPEPVQRYLDWILSETGQRLAERAGYQRVPGS